MLTAPAATAEDDESTQASSATAIRNALPVHSWQYDQLVFTDPTPTLYALLLAHPETPLPERSLRASQRQIIERSAADLGSEPHGDGELDLSTTLDQGSTGVPIEFTRQLERGEGENLERVRRHLVEQTDEWRARLIDLEQEAMQLREQQQVRV